MRSRAATLASATTLLRSPQTLLWILAALTLYGVLPLAWQGFDPAERSIPFRSRIFTDAHRQNLVTLVFPAVAAMPYAVSFWWLVRDRFLMTLSLRAGRGVALGGQFVICALTTWSVFFVAGLLPVLVMCGGEVDPHALGRLSPVELANAEARDTSFSELTRWGPWALPLGYAAWVGLNAALYACMSLALSLLQANRLIALAAPWVGFTVLATAMAWVGLEGYSPDLVMPFNMSPLPAVNFLVALMVPTGSLAILIVLVWRRRESLHGCQ